MRQAIRPIFVLIATAILMASTATAYADSIVVFSLSGVTLTSGATATGTLTIDTTTGTATDLDITYDSTVHFIGVEFQFTTAGRTVFETLAADETELDLEIPQLTLVGYTGGSLCTTVNTCGPHALVSLISFAFLPDPRDPDPFTAGSLIATTSSVPEPSSLTLLGTSVLALAGLVRRKFSST